MLVQVIERENENYWFVGGRQ